MKNVMSIEMYNFIKDNLHKITVLEEEGKIVTPKGTNGTICSSTGYLRAKVNKKTLQVHQILAVVYFGEECIGKQINHKDTNKLNNKKHNLEICTQRENVKHAWENGLHENDKRHNLNKTLGSEHFCAKLADEDIIFIRESGLPSKELADMFNVSTRNIRLIRARKIWKHI